jgi:hypothetical protein
MAASNFTGGRVRGSEIDEYRVCSRLHAKLTSDPSDVTWQLKMNTGNNQHARSDKNSF